MPNVNSTTLASLKQRSFDSSEGLTKKQVSSVIDSFISNIKDDLAGGKSVAIKDFAQFSVLTEGDTIVPTVKWSKKFGFDLASTSDS